ncbi:MAG: hypothetical protein ACUVWA_06070 [Candidatus Oleimicrobiaceae bacterium]
MGSASATRNTSSLGSRVARHRLRQQRRRLLRYAAALVVASGALLLYVWQWVHAQELMRQIASHEKRVAALNKEVAQLEAIREALVGFDRITTQATQRFNLGFHSKRNLVVPTGLRSLVEEERRHSGE